MRQLLALCDSYESYATVISSMRQLLALSDSYQPNATVIGPKRQLWVPSDSYQLYATVINPIRQLLALCNSYEVYATVINPIRQLQKKKSSMTLLGHRHEQYFLSVFIYLLMKNKLKSSQRKYLCCNDKETKNEPT